MDAGRDTNYACAYRASGNRALWFPQVHLVSKTEDRVRIGNSDFYSVSDCLSVSRLLRKRIEFV